MDITTPEELGFSAQRLGQIDTVMQGHVDDGILSGGLVVVWRHGAVGYAKPFGMADIENNIPTRLDMIYRIYSMTKPIVSAAVMMLNEQGRLALNDPVAKYIPDFAKLKVYVNGIKQDALAQPMTIHHLLTHTSGLTYGFLNESPVDLMYQKTKIDDDRSTANMTLEQWVKKLARLPLVNQPGSAWRYSVSTDVLGYLVQVISGVSLGEFLQENIFAPLGMVDTGFYVPEEKLDRFVPLYGAGLWVMDPARGGYAQPTKLESGGGGLVSTASDYLRFCRMMLNKGELDGVRLLGRKTVEFMTMNHIRPELMPIAFPDNVMWGVGFGLGFGVTMDTAQTQTLGSAGEYSWGGAASTVFWIDPAEQLIAIMMTQLMSINRRNEAVIKPDFGQQLRTAIYQALVD